MFVLPAHPRKVADAVRHRRLSRPSWSSNGHLSASLLLCTTSCTFLSLSLSLSLSWSTGRSQRFLSLFFFSFPGCSSLLLAFDCCYIYTRMGVFGCSIFYICLFGSLTGKKKHKKKKKTKNPKNTEQNKQRLLVI